ncbi:MAG TPA: tRNA pseudouridine(55) synthase TruB [Firmicutes bacterium]|nr:tRNA pseudouridine(55) synthase TruB [Bacillota bacterium]
MNGIINVIKPMGMSSHQVVAHLRRLLKTRRVGHAGTLDPGAGGLLTVCVGQATKLMPFMVEYDKAYVAEMTVGLSTSTQDAAGETEKLTMDFQITPSQLAEALAAFRGEIQQIPPMASAIRMKGKRLYELSREGVTVERKPRNVRISAIHVNKVWNEHEDLLTFGSRVLLYVECSKGTYIRTLCHDIGEKLGVGAHMSFLSRVRSGPFDLGDSFTLEEIADLVSTGDLSFLLPMTRALPDWAQVKISPIAEERVRNGNPVTPEDFVDVPRKLDVDEQVFLLDVTGSVLAIGQIRRAGGLICQPIRVFMEG